MNIYMSIYYLSEKFKTSRWGNLVLGFLDDIGLRGGVNRLTLWRSREKIVNKKRIEDNITYWNLHSEEIDEVCAMLSDDFSERVLRGMIKYRCTGKYKDLPPNAISTQYFINEFFKYKDGEVYVDCGAFDGDTCLRFERIARRNKVSRYSIVAFEPDPSNYEKLVRRLPYVKCINKGLWDSTTTLSFKATGDITAKVSSEDGADNIKVDVTTIDECEECRDATFIKMDIEGAEYNAILGAKETIIRNRPKLAICIYHSNEDMLRIIKLVHEMVPEYSIYVRQHTNAMDETVMYACE